MQTIATTPHYSQREAERLTPQALRIFSDLINDRLSLKKKPPTKEEYPNPRTGVKRKSIHYNNTRYIFEIQNKTKTLITAYSTLQYK